MAGIVFTVKTTRTEAVSAVSKRSQPAPETPLDKAAVEALIEELSSALEQCVKNEDEFNAIVEKWQARKLVGETRSQILQLLFADVKLVGGDKQTQDQIWESWNDLFRRVFPFTCLEVTFFSQRS